MNKVGTFVKDGRVVYGTAVAMRFNILVWAGPVAQTPLDSFEPDTRILLHPESYERIHRAAQALEEGIPDEESIGTRET
jgi:hypothetical protein